MMIYATEAKRNNVGHIDYTDNSWTIIYCCLNILSIIDYKSIEEFP